MSIKYLSICSGIESAGLGWHPLGYECIGLAEIDPFRSAVLQYHYPEIKNYEDFTKIQASDLPTRPVLLVGGTPCATFSIAGLRKGLGEDRGNLALEFVKLIERLQPTWVVWENVPGILSSNGGQDLGTFLGSLAELGYGFAYRVLNTEHVRTQRFPNALPQRRRRIFVIGHIGGDWKSPAKVLFDNQPMSKDFKPSRRTQKTTAQKSEENIGESDTEYWRKTDRDGNYVEEFKEQRVSSTLTAGGRFSMEQGAVVVKDPTIMMRDSQTGSNGAPWNENDVSWSLTAMTGGNRQPIVFRESIKRNDIIRRLTPVECERLQGLPDNYTQIPYRGKPKEECPVSKRYEACGRAMSVNIMEWLGSRIKQVHNGEI